MCIGIDPIGLAHIENEQIGILLQALLGIPGHDLPDLNQTVAVHFDEALYRDASQ